MGDDKGRLVQILVEDLASDDEAKVEKGLSDLADLCSVENANEKENRAKAYQIGAPLTVIRKFKKYRPHVGVQRQASRALRSLTVDGEACKLMVELGAIETVIVSMNEHKNDTLVQEYGMACLSNLIYEKDKANVERLLACNGLDTVAAAMQSHADMEELQSCGCSFFATVCNWPEYVPQIAKAGGFSAVTQAVETYTDSAGVQENGRNALKVLITT